MTLKGDYSGLTPYSKDDVVRWDNGEIYRLLKPCDTGTPPTDTLYWGKILDPIASVISMVIDLMNTVNTAVATIPTNIDDEGIVLKGTGDAEYLISVDDSGDTPELDVTLIEEEEEEGGDT